MSVLALLVVAAQVSGRVVAPEAPPPRSPGLHNATCSSVRVTTPQLAIPPADVTFSSRKILDLEFRTRMRRDVTGDHLLHLKVFTPNGFLYQVLTVPFTAGVAVPDRATNAGRGAAPGAPAVPATRVVPGYPRPLPVQTLGSAAASRDGGSPNELVSRLPVAGTSITLSSLYGRWTVEPYLDGATGPCGPVSRFTIRE